MALSYAEFLAGMRLVPIRPQPRPLVVPQPIPGYRDGSWDTGKGLPAFDNRMPALPVANWTPHSGVTGPAPGWTMERF